MLMKKHPLYIVYMLMGIIFKNKLCNIEKYIKKLSARGRKKTWQKMLMTINNSLNHSHNLNSSIYICDVFCVCDVFFLSLQQCHCS